MVIDQDLRIEATLAVSTVSGTHPEYHVNYVDYNNAGEKTMPSYTRGILTNTTDIVILAAPINNQRREVILAAFFNPNTVSTTFIIKTQDGLTSTERRIISKVIESNGTLHYQQGVGFYPTNS